MLTLRHKKQAKCEERQPITPSPVYFYTLRMAWDQLDDLVKERLPEEQRALYEMDYFIPHKVTINDEQQSIEIVFTTTHRMKGAKFGFDSIKY